MSLLKLADAETCHIYRLLVFVIFFSVKKKKGYDSLTPDIDPLISVDFYKQSVSSQKEVKITLNVLVFYSTITIKNR